MDAIEFYHRDECSTDIYKAMESFSKHKLIEELNYLDGFIQGANEDTISEYVQKRTKELKKQPS